MNIYGIYDNEFECAFYKVLITAENDKEIVSIIREKMIDNNSFLRRCINGDITIYKIGYFDNKANINLLSNDLKCIIDNGKMKVLANQVLSHIIKCDNIMSNILKRLDNKENNDEILLFEQSSDGETDPER